MVGISVTCHMRKGCIKKYVINGMKGMDSSRSFAFPGALWQRLRANLPSGEGQSAKEVTTVATENTPLMPPLVTASYYVAPVQTGERGAFAARPLGQGAVVGVAIQRRVGIFLIKTALGRAINTSLEPNCRLVNSPHGYLLITRVMVPTAVELTVSNWDWPRVPTL